MTQWIRLSVWCLCECKFFRVQMVAQLQNTSNFVGLFVLVINYGKLSRLYYRLNHRYTITPRRIIWFFFAINCPISTKLVNLNAIWIWDRYHRLELPGRDGGWESKEQFDRFSPKATWRTLGPLFLLLPVTDGPYLQFGNQGSRHDFVSHDLAVQISD